MSGLPRELRDLIESGPMAHLSTINADGSLLGWSEEDVSGDGSDKLIDALVAQGSPRWDCHDFTRGGVCEGWRSGGAGRACGRGRGS